MLYGAADFLGGLASRRANTIAIVVVSQGAGLLVLGERLARVQLFGIVCTLLAVALIVG